MDGAARAMRSGRATQGVLLLAMVGVLVVWSVGCDGGAEQPAATKTAGATGAPAAGSTEATPEATKPPAAPVPKAAAPKDRAGAVGLGEAFGAATTAGEAQKWLGEHSVYPFDVDGKAQANNAKELGEAMTRDLADLVKQVEPHKTCVAATRQEILEGKPWPYLDRLGKRAPKDELARDLDRLKLVEGEWLVNCYHDTAPGYFLIVAASGHVRAFRN